MMLSTILRNKVFILFLNSILKTKKEFDIPKM